MRFFTLSVVLCVFLSGCFFISTHVPEELPIWIRSSEFVKQGTFSPDYHRLKDEFDWHFKSEDLAWENAKNIFFVNYYDSVDYIMSLPFDRFETEIYKLYSIDAGHLAETLPSFEDCMERNVKEEISTVYNLCKKKKSMPQSLIKKMKSFLLDDKKSLESWNTQCRGRLHMFFYDGEKYLYFDMDNPKCVDANLEKDPRIPEYIEFYNEMAAFIKQDFSECRWDNFGNKDKIIRECGKFNWRWKREYPELVNK